MSDIHEPIVQESCCEKTAEEIIDSAKDIRHRLFKLEMVERAVLRYHLALDERRNGNVARQRLIDQIQDALDMPWKQGKVLEHLQNHPTAAVWLRK